MIVIPYDPRPLQMEIHRELKRWNVMVCHRRFGKTVLAINELVRRALLNKKKAPRYAYFAPLLRQAKDIAWDYVKEFTLPIPGVKYNEAELRCDLPNGARITLYGVDRSLDTLRGNYFDGCILDEYAQMPPRIWEVLAPALADRKGWVVVIGTPMGRNAFYDLYQMAQENDDWYAAMFKASETNVLDEEELTIQKRTLSPEQFAQEYECSWSAAVQGAYYSKYIEQARADKRITDVPVDPALPVHTFWDLGVSDATSIWMVQPAGLELRVVAYYENNNESLQHYINYLHDFRDKHNIAFGDHFAPHDIKVRELTNGKSRLETARAMGIRFRITPNIKIMDGIEAARRILPRCWFDEKRCSEGINALQNYRAEYDDKKKIYRDKPLHDWSSHASDAFRYFAVAWRDRRERNSKPVQADLSWLNDRAA